MGPYQRAAGNRKRGLRGAGADPPSAAPVPDAGVPARRFDAGISFQGKLVQLCFVGDLQQLAGEFHLLHFLEGALAAVLGIARLELLVVCFGPLKFVAYSARVRSISCMAASSRVSRVSSVNADGHCKEVAGLSH